MIYEILIFIIALLFTNIIFKSFILFLEVLGNIVVSARGDL
jgi:hypothetical protein